LSEWVYNRGMTFFYYKKQLYCILQQLFLSYFYYFCGAVSYFCGALVLPNRLNGKTSIT